MCFPGSTRRATDAIQNTAELTLLTAESPKLLPRLRELAYIAGWAAPRGARSA